MQELAGTQGHATYQRLFCKKETKPADLSWLGGLPPSGARFLKHVAAVHRGAFDGHMAQWARSGKTPMEILQETCAIVAKGTSLAPYVGTHFFF